MAYAVGPGAQHRPGAVRRRLRPGQLWLSWVAPPSLRATGLLTRRTQGDFRMTGDDLGKMILRNKLLGRWAAEKLGLTGREAKAYSDALATGTPDPVRSDVFSIIRKDFDAAGVAQSDQDILRVMTELMLTAGTQMQGRRAGSPDAAAVMLARNLMKQ